MFFVKEREVDKKKEVFGIQIITLDDENPQST